MSVLLVVFWFSVTSISALSAAGRSTFLFVLFDAGETHALLPVMQKMDRNGVDYQVLALGTASTLQLPAKLAAGRVMDMESGLGQVIDKSRDRYLGVPQEQITDVLNTTKPDTLVIGVASEIQRQFAEAFAGKGRVVAYFDNYGSVDNISYAPVVRKIEALADVFMVPSKDVAETADAKQTRVVGQPALEAWVAQLGSIDRQGVRKKAGLDNRQKVVTFIGGYDPEYRDVLKVFVEGIKTRKDYQAIIRPHPKADPEIEASIIREAGCRNCRISTSDMTTMEAVAIADTIVCHHSTVGIQALFAGKKIIYIDVPGATFTNPDLSRWKLSRQVFSTRAFLQALRAKKKKRQGTKTLFKEAGIPEQAVDNIYTLLVAPAKSSKSTKTDSKR